MSPPGYYMGCRHSHPEAILQIGRGMYDLPLVNFHQFPAKTTPGTFKVALDSAVSRIACAGSDHAIRIIDWYSGQVITDGFGHGEPATSLCFSHDNGQLVSVSGAAMFQYVCTQMCVRNNIWRQKKLFTC
jgi:WD40 repeat protein